MAVEINDLYQSALKWLIESMVVMIEAAAKDRSSCLKQGKMGTGKTTETPLEIRITAEALHWALLGGKAPKERKSASRAEELTRFKD